MSFFGVATILAVLLTIPAYLWYVSVGLTSAANLTAIYNTGCFFAYLFSILMLHDRLVAAKVCAVGLCIAGVFIMAYGSQQATVDDDNGQTDSSAPDPSNLIGIIVAVLSAVSYGFYESLLQEVCLALAPLCAICQRDHRHHGHCDLTRAVDPPAAVTLVRTGTL